MRSAPSVRNARSPVAHARFQLAVYLALFAGLNQRDIFDGVRSAERIKNTFGDRTSPARQKLAENFLARLGRTDVLQRCWSYEPSNHEPLVNRLPDLALFAGLFGDDAPILNFCRTFGHHRSPSPANQYCGYRTLSPVAF